MEEARRLSERERKRKQGIESNKEISKFTRQQLKEMGSKLEVGKAPDSDDIEKCL